ncbi:MAG: glycine oxidase ThiO [Microcoleaceae cyanobacterium]
MNTQGDVVIIGGGLIGLSIALELKLRGATVTVLSRDFQEAAAHAAAGMLAPQAEAIQQGSLLELALRSRALYQNWIRKLEEITGLDTGYWPCGILAPIYQQPQSTVGSQSAAAPAYWLERESLDQHQPGLGSEVVGGWWFPLDAQVDNRRGLARALQSAAQELGVNLWEGTEVQSLVTDHSSVVLGLKTNRGEVRGSHYILATGAWSAQVLPQIPVYPIKGQMVSVRVPPAFAQLPLKQVLFGQEIYIVPRQDGLIVIGATVEQVNFDPGLTPEGIQGLLSRAIRLYPELQNFPIQEFWWGFRPTTSDLLPILGHSPFENLTLAVGHHRNGILLAPITAQLIADWVLEQRSDPILDNFCWDRFPTVQG